MANTCCKHCRLQDSLDPFPDDLVMEWDEHPLLPRWLTSAVDLWVTREGRVIPIKELEDSHLHNIHQMLLRIQSEADEVAVDDERHQPIGGGPPTDLFDRKLDAIEAEIKRRAGG